MNSSLKKDLLTSSIWVLKQITPSLMVEMVQRGNAIRLWLLQAHNRYSFSRLNHSSELLIFTHTQYKITNSLLK
jgi:hypothetical protein